MVSVVPQLSCRATLAIEEGYPSGYGSGLLNRTGVKSCMGSNPMPSSNKDILSL